MQDEMAGVEREATDHVMEAALSFGGIQWVVDREGTHYDVACMSSSGLRDFILNYDTTKRPGSELPRKIRRLEASDLGLVAFVAFHAAARRTVRRTFQKVNFSAQQTEISRWHKQFL